MGNCPTLPTVEELKELHCNTKVSVATEASTDVSTTTAVEEEATTDVSTTTTENVEEEATTRVTVVVPGSDATALHLGGGVWGANGNAVRMTRQKGDSCTGECTVWAADVPSTHANGYFTILKNAGSDTDWKAKEHIKGQKCAQNEYNDRKFPANMSQPLQLSFGNCEVGATQMNGVWQLPPTTRVTVVVPGSNIL